MDLAVLSSGSSGNCFYIGDKKDGILIDAGISCRQISERLEKLRVPISKIRGAFITHEHTDHTRGAEVLSRTHNIPVFATEKTAKSLSCDNLKIIENKDCVKIGGMEIESFSKSHQAADPVSFSISEGKKRASIITDAGFCCNNVLREISDADFLCLEANHDLRMLDEGAYPVYLKRWIRSDTGHLSNMQAGLAVLEHAPSRLKNVILSHISRNNNTPALALKTFNSLIKERSDLRIISLAPKHGSMTEMFRI